jgi:GTP cyclohydrolase I
MVREIAVRFDGESRIDEYEIEVENHESIHDHNAYAAVRKVKVPQDGL